LDGEAAALRERWPDAATVLLTALGPGPRLWERGGGHPDTLTLRLGTADLPSEDGFGTLRAVPFTIDLLDPHTYVLGLAGPRPRLAALARSVLAQAAALHAPSTLEIVLISADRSRPAEQRAEEWAWLNWLPHLRPARGQDCRLLLALDREQAEARTAELVRRLEDGPLGPGWAFADRPAVAKAANRREGPYTLLIVDSDPGSAALHDAVRRIAAAGPSVGVHVLCLAERPDRLAADCGAVALLEGDVATTLRIEPYGPERLTLDAVSSAWAERLARALAALREGDAAPPPVRSTLPATARLLDELDLALATPAKITARWARSDAAAVPAVLGAGTDGPVHIDLVAEGPHLMAGGAPGSGKTELLRSIAGALATSERPDRLTLVLVDGAGSERGEGLRACTDLPHVSTYLSAADPIVMREFAQALSAELKRRDALLGDADFGQWHAERMFSGRVPRQSHVQAEDGRRPSQQGPVRVQTRSGTPLPRLVVIVDDFDALVAPALGSTGRPAAGSVVRALESVARDGARLGVHLVASTGRPERTTGTDVDEESRLRIALRTEEPDAAALLVHIEDPAGLDDAVPGRGYLLRPGGAVTVFQTGRISGRIPRTSTLRPTVVPLEWARMGDPPTRRPLRELGNGPTDLALLASALQRAAESVGAESAPPLL
jgi:DNA segregation ATPase FtsK/SpoIIIE-like protein